MDNIFSILIKNSDNSYSHKGTGFLVGSKGQFISAGHVFNGIENPCDRFFGAFPSSCSKLMKINSIEIEYKYIEKQQGPVYKDLAVGVLDLHHETHLNLKLKRPSIKTPLTIKGLVSVKDDNKFTLKEDKTIDLSQIEPEPFDTEVENIHAIISKDMDDYEKSESLVNNKKKYNNALTLKRYAHHGSSGCPVVNSEGEAVGMFFGGPENHRVCHIITSKYIDKSMKRILQN